MEPRQTGEQPSLAIHFQLMGIWERLLGVRVHGIDANFFDLGGHSGLLPQMMRKVERLTAKEVPVTAFLHRPTIRHLAQCLVEQARKDNMFVCVQRGTRSVPFYFFHGDILGGGFYSRKLAKLLGEDQPFHVSAPIELKEDELPSVLELAARKRDALQRRQPHGPYIFGGFCVGAVVAYEVARQLERDGEDVRGVLLIEPEIGNVLTRSHQKVVNRVAARGRQAREKVETFMRGLKKIDRLRDVWHAPLREKTEFVVKNSRKLLTRRGAVDQTTTTAGIAEGNAGISATDREWLIAAYHWILTSYVPKRYRGRITLFLTDDHLEQTPFILKQWQKAAPQTQVERIPGKHLTCITTHLAAIAKKIRLELETLRTFVSMLLPAVSSQLGLFEI